MRLGIDFDAVPGLSAVEVDDQPIDGILAARFVPQLAVAQRAPTGTQRARLEAGWWRCQRARAMSSWSTGSESTLTPTAL